MSRISPCVGCTRVECPEQCDNKGCRIWQQWFLCRWEELRRKIKNI